MRKFAGYGVLCCGILFLSFVFTNSISLGDDGRLVKVCAEIEEDWEIILRDSQLIIASKDTCWVDYYNSAGAPWNDPERKKYTDEYLQQHMPGTKLFLSMKVEVKWTSKQFLEARNKNKAIGSKIDRLIEKHQLQNVSINRRYNEEWISGATPEEEKRFAHYQKEKQELEKQMMALPDYTSDKYSLFVVSKTWDVYGGYMLPMISPSTMFAEIDSLETTLNKHLKND